MALGDCAVTGNVPAMRNGIATRKLLERIYVEGASEGQGVPTDGVPPLAPARRSPCTPAWRSTFTCRAARPGRMPSCTVLGELLDGRLPDVGSKLRFG